MCIRDRSGPGRRRDTVERVVELDDGHLRFIRSVDVCPRGRERRPTHADPALARLAGQEAHHECDFVGRADVQEPRQRVDLRLARTRRADRGGGLDDDDKEHAAQGTVGTMDYRRLGRSGLQVSVLSFGSWVSFRDQLGVDTAMECLDAAYQAGVNFFDNAEGYAEGESESIMGQAISKLGWARHSYVISTKVFWGLHDEPNMKNTLNRKYLMQAIDGSLERMGLGFVDLLFCHRADPKTPIEETVWAMSDIVSSGKALYWGTSEWTPDEIRAAWEIAERHHLHKPVMEQPQYNLLHRMRVEFEYARLYEDIGLGLTTWSPLASGLLTGKYFDGMPEGSRALLPGYEWLQDMLT